MAYLGRNWSNQGKTVMTSNKTSALANFILTCFQHVLVVCSCIFLELKYLFISKSSSEIYCLFVMSNRTEVSLDLGSAGSTAGSGRTCSRYSHKVILSLIVLTSIVGSFRRDRFRVFDFSVRVEDISPPPDPKLSHPKP